MMARTDAGMSQCRWKQEPTRAQEPVGRLAPSGDLKKAHVIVRRGSAPDPICKQATSHLTYARVCFCVFGHVPARLHEGEQKCTERERPYGTRHRRVLRHSSLDPFDNVGRPPREMATEKDFWFPEDAGISHGAPALISAHFLIHINKYSWWRAGVWPEQIYRLSQKPDNAHLRTFCPPSISLPRPAPAFSLRLSPSLSLPPAACSFLQKA